MDTGVIGHWKELTASILIKRSWYEAVLQIFNIYRYSFLSVGSGLCKDSLLFKMLRTIHHEWWAVYKTSIKSFSSFTSMFYEMLWKREWKECLEECYETLFSGPGRVFGHRTSPQLLLPLQDHTVKYYSGKDTRVSMSHHVLPLSEVLLILLATSV